jgi:hypothetical protein
VDAEARDVSAGSRRGSSSPEAISSTPASTTRSPEWRTQTERAAIGNGPGDRSAEAGAGTARRALNELLPEARERLSQELPRPSPLSSLPRSAKADGVEAWLAWRSLTAETFAQAALVAALPRPGGRSACAPAVRDRQEPPPTHAEHERVETPARERLSASRSAWTTTWDGSTRAIGLTAFARRFRACNQAPDAVRSGGVLCSGENFWPTFARLKQSELI